MCSYNLHDYECLKIGNIFDFEIWKWLHIRLIRKYFSNMYGKFQQYVQWILATPNTIFDQYFSNMYNEFQQHQIQYLTNISAAPNTIFAQNFSKTKTQYFTNIWATPSIIFDQYFISTKHNIWPKLQQQQNTIDQFQRQFKKTPSSSSSSPPLPLPLPLPPSAAIGPTLALHIKGENCISKYDDDKLIIKHQWMTYLDVDAKKVVVSFDESIIFFWQVVGPPWQYLVVCHMT